MEFQHELVQHCFVRDTGADDEVMPKEGVEKRRREAEDILNCYRFASPAEATGGLEAWRLGGLAFL